MKTKYALLAALTLGLTLPMFGQSTHDDMTKTDMKKHDMSGMMGKPTFETTSEGLHTKVWLMTQKEHKKMMKGKMGQMMMMHDEKEGAMEHKEMKKDGMEKDKGMMGMKHDGMDKDMKEMKHDGMGMDNATREAMMAGTHHIMLDVTDATSGKEVVNASAKILILSPSKKNSSVELKSTMMNHFGSGLTLDEKGEYQLTASVNVGGVSKTTKFKYTVK